MSEKKKIAKNYQIDCQEALDIAEDFKDFIFELPNEWDEFEENSLKKKKVRLTGKYKEKRYVP